MNFDQEPIKNDLSEDKIVDVPSYYVERKPEPKPKRRKPFLWIITILISALIGGVVSSYVMPVYVFGKLIPYPMNYFGADQKKVIRVSQEQSKFLASAVVKKAMPSVVGITTESTAKDFFFGPIKESGVGTGVVVDSRGYILTNSHVVNDGKFDQLQVIFNDGNKKAAKVLWNDPKLDLAVIKVDGVNVVPADLGNSEELEVGEAAVAIGNPVGMGEQRTVTAGIVSGLNRTLRVSQQESIDNLIQTDASINPGNSGGPLLNYKGEVIGINTVKLKAAEGLGFAIPINTAKPIVDQIIQKGEFKKVYLGIKGMDPKLAQKYFGIELSVDKGVFILQVTENSPASYAQLKMGDIILQMNGKNVESMDQLSRTLYQYRPGDKVNLKILRDGKEKTVQVILKNS